jgi:L-threonylcarbamoyladenylate synthase
VAVIPHDAEAFARALYAELHQCDEAGAKLIVVETPPSGEEWRAITDRLTRAAGGGCS